MKQILRMTGLIRPLLLMLALLLFGNARGWAEVSTLTFTKACGGSGTADDGVAWTVTSDGNESNFDNTRGIHYGTGSANVQYIKLTTSGISGTITKVVVNASTASGVSATADVTVGGQAFGGNAQSLTSSATNYTFTGSASGAIVVTVTKPSSATKAIYVKSVAVTYSTVADNRTAVNMTGFTATSTALVKGNTTTTTVTNDQPGWTAVYTYASNDEDVATVANDGVITAVGKGKAVITASLNINPEDASYKAGSVTQKTVEITVSLPTHTATFSVNGQTTTQDFEEGEAITFPTDPADVEGKTFVGWTSEAINGTTDEAPTKVTSATMGESDVTYYAVFATKTEDESGSYTLDYDNESELSSSTDWGSYGTSYRYTASDGGIWTIKAYKSSGMQINAGRNSSIKVPNCAGYIQSIEIKGSASKAVGFSAEDYFGSSTLNTFLAEGTDATSQTLDLSAASVTGGYIVPKSGSISITKIVVNYLATSYSNYCTTVAADTREDAGIAFTGTTNEYTANLGEAFSNPELSAPQGVTITYSSSNTAVATVDASTGAVTLVAAGETTITATSEANNNYKAGSASYTLTVVDPNAPGTQNNPYTVAQALAAITTLESTDATTENYYVRGIVSSFQSTSVVGDGSNYRYYISDDGTTSAQLLVYKGQGLNNVAFSNADDLQLGDEVVILGPFLYYNSKTPEIAAGNYIVSLNRKAEAGLSFDEETATAVLGEAFTAPTLSNEHQLSVTWSSSNTAVATIDASTGAVTLVAAGETTITASFAGNNNYKAGSASYTLTVESNEPSIVFDGIQNPALERCTAGNTNIHYVTNNLTEQVSIVLCDAEGIAATYDWFSAELYGESYVAVSWQANEDAENDRTAYFYLQSGNTRSEIFALTQEKFVADYAALPFAFDGGKADIEKTNGLSQTGLGSDYGSSPYLKFDTTGDNLILKLNETPGTLTFDIKGNSFSGGTFKVQTSANGVTYTDLESYTTFANNTQSEEFESLSADVRYIKWIYTEKSNGNVALGNIKVAKPVVPSTDPTITLSATSIEATFAEADGTITVTCENMGDAPELDIIFCDAQGTEATYNWIAAEINDENNVYYTISANEGEARTAYMKVYGLDTEANDVYSELITITQAGLVIDYATLPFSYDGNGKGTLPLGLTASGIGTYDYSPKMKFDGTDDVLVLKTEGGAAVLSFDIKGNSFSGGTFTVQTSTDGTEYTDLNTYNELDATTTERFNLGADVHYIKWIYTEKVTGNVALGNIKVNKPEAVTVTAAGYATYCSENALSFEGTGIKAYVGTLNGTELTFTPITEAPANTGLLLVADGGKTANAAIITEAAAVTNNCLTGVTTETTLSSEDYILNVKEAGAGFYKAGNYTTLGANRAYIAAQQGGQVKGFVINLNGDLPTGVAQMDGEKLNADDAAIFNLNGQRISKPQKGVNIVNGKKVLVK